MRDISALGRRKAMWRDLSGRTSVVLCGSPPYDTTSAGNARTRLAPLLPNSNQAKPP